MSYENMDKMQPYLRSNLYNHDQLQVIDKALSLNITDNLLSIVTKPHNTSYTMRALLYGIQHGLSEADLEILSRHKNDMVETDVLFAALKNEKNLNREAIEYLSDLNLSGNQLFVVLQALEHDVPMEAIKKFAKHELSFEQMSECYAANLKGFKQKYIDLLSKPELGGERAHLLSMIIEQGLSYNALKLLAQDNLSNGQFFQIYTGFLNNLSVPQVATYADSRLLIEQMIKARELLEDGVDIKKVRVLCKNRMDKKRINPYVSAIKLDLSIEQLNLLDTAHTDILDTIIPAINDGLGYYEAAFICKMCDKASEATLLNNILKADEKQVLLDFFEDIVESQDGSKKVISLADALQSGLEFKNLKKIASLKNMAADELKKHLYKTYNMTDKSLVPFHEKVLDASERSHMQNNSRTVKDDLEHDIRE